jgi:hypothetical protein
MMTKCKPRLIQQGDFVSGPCLYRSLIPRDRTGRGIETSEMVTTSGWRHSLRDKTLNGDGMEDRLTKAQTARRRGKER